MSLIASPLFKTDASEKLAATDVYEISNTKPINKIFDAAKGMGERLIERGGGVRGIASSITNIIQLKSAGATGRQLLESGLGMFGTSAAGILKTVSGDILDKAGTYIDLDPELVGKIKSAGSEVVYQVQYGDPTDLSRYGELTSLIGSMTGLPELSEYVNIGYESAVWGATLSNAVDYGSSYYISDVKESVDPAVYRQALIYLTPSVARSGDVNALDQLMTNLNIDEIMAAAPDFIFMFLTNFKMPTSITVSIELYAIEFFNKLALLDSRWYLYNRNGVDIVDMKYMTTMSDDARRLFETHSVIGVAVQMAPKYPEVSTSEVVREQYPLMVDLA
ncbi:hypothetical protein D9M68_20560 [compost metagenome]